MQTGLLIDSSNMKPMFTTPQRNVNQMGVSGNFLPTLGGMPNFPQPQQPITGHDLEGYMKTMLSENTTMVQKPSAMDKKTECNVLKKEVDLIWQFEGDATTPEVKLVSKVFPKMNVKIVDIKPRLKAELFLEVVEPAWCLPE